MTIAIAFSAIIKPALNLDTPDLIRVRSIFQVNTEDSNQQFKIYPNPAAESLISIEAKMPFEKVWVRLFTLNGKLVKSRHIEYFHKNSVVFGLSDSRAGMYIMTINGPNLNESHKFIKL